MKKITLVISLLFVSLSTLGQEITSLPAENYSIKNLAENTKYQDYGVSYAGDSTVIKTVGQPYFKHLIHQ